MTRDIFEKLSLICIILMTPYLSRLVWSNSNARPESKLCSIQVHYCILHTWSVSSVTLSNSFSSISPNTQKQFPYLKYSKCIKWVFILKINKEINIEMNSILVLRIYLSYFSLNFVVKVDSPLPPLGFYTRNSLVFLILMDLSFLLGVGEESVKKILSLLQVGHYTFWIYFLHPVVGSKFAGSF